MSKKIISALDEYINRVYKLVLLLVPGACECAGLAYTFSKFMGWLPTVSWTALIIFDSTCLLYLAIGILFIKTGIKDGVVIKSRLTAGKIFLAIIMLIQFNFILYMIPATDFWGFAFFFVILTAFFLDWKIVALTAVEISGSLVVSWFAYGEVHLPAGDDSFQVNMLDRVVCVALSLATIVLLTFLINKFLVNAKKDEMQRNAEQVQNVLAAVQALSESLHTSGNALSQVAEIESESANRLAATSKELVESSNQLSKKTNESTANLNELNRWQGVVAENVQKVESTSHDLLDKSTENQKVIGDLQTINAEVSDSMKLSIEIAKKLSEAVNEIGATLKFINDISSSTNILSINASIEAARAGNAGKGFAVVASEVGKLAASTQTSLKTVQAVIECVQQNVKDITVQVEENFQKLDMQNQYFESVFRYLHEMSDLLNVSVSAVETMSSAYEKQAEVIDKTAAINEDIADNIRSENEQFGYINSMAENNAGNTAEVAAQASAINEMVEKITELLAQ